MKGSIVIKKMHIINMIQNEKFIFRSRVSRDTKRYSWGRETAFKNILENDYSHIEWDEFMNTIEGAFQKSWLTEGIEFILRAHEVEK